MAYGLWPMAYGLDGRFIDCKFDESAAKKAV
jgi:hypothetical protein